MNPPLQVWVQGSGVVIQQKHLSVRMDSLSLLQKLIVDLSAVQEIWEQHGTPKRDADQRPA